MRYAVDDHIGMKFLFPKGRLLVFRAETIVKVQVSNPDGVDIRYNSGGYIKFSESKNRFEPNGSISLAFPHKRVEIIKDLFPGSKALPVAPNIIPSTAVTSTASAQRYRASA